MLSLAFSAALSAAVAFVAAGPVMAPASFFPPMNCAPFASNSVGYIPSLCRPVDCTQNYTVQADETCNIIVGKYPGIIAQDLYRWNPEIGQSCFGLQAFVPVCVNVAGHQAEAPVPDGDRETADQVPVPILPYSVSNCNTFEYTGSDGHPTLADIQAQNGLTKQQWNLLNWPNYNDPNGDYAVWADYYSCVAA